MAVASPTRGELERLSAALDADFPFYSEQCLTIINKQARPVPFVLNEPQVRLDRTIEAQRAAGKPVRVIILKSRQIGFSTYVQGRMIRTCTRQSYRRALVVAQNRGTAAGLWAIGNRMYNHLPADIPGIKPPLTGMQRGQSMHWGEPSRVLQQTGMVGIDSKLTVDTANEAESGRGFTYTDVHLSEVAFWENSDKMPGILNTVPDDPGTAVFLESTANGANFFKAWWDRAVHGESEYIPFFVGWTDDPSCWREFATPADREAFVETIGTGPYGEAEPNLVELFGCTPEQLYWRRYTISDKNEGRVELFNQEYPATAEEAFILSGAQVFSTAHIQRVVKHARETPPKHIGLLKVTSVKEDVKARVGTVDIPLTVEFVDRSTSGAGRGHSFWHIWELPDPDDDYIAALDPMGGEPNDQGELAHHGIQVISHRTGQQVARWQSRIDPDLAGMQLLHAAIFYNQAWAVPETTGGYGGAIARRLYEDFKYAYTYRRTSIDKLTQRREKKIGWDTNSRTKPWLEETMMELLREQVDGIRDLETALELASYVRDEKGKTGPSEGAFADLLMALMIAQFVKRELPMKRRKT